MSSADVTAILQALSELTARVNSMVVNLAKIEERTTVLSDHEQRIRAAEEAARVAGETAAAAKQEALAQAARIRILEDVRTQESGGRILMGRTGQIITSVIGLVVAALAIAAYVHNW